MAIERKTSIPGIPVKLPFSLASSTKDYCFISGMPALDGDGKYAEGTFQDEASLAWLNVMEVARYSGFAARNAVLVQCLLSDIAYYDQLNRWWCRTFPSPSESPARVTYEVGALPFGAKVEFQVVVARDL